MSTGQTIAARAVPGPYTIELDREDDGRWIAEIVELPGCMVYGDTEDEALRAVIELVITLKREGVADRVTRDVLAASAEARDEYRRGETVDAEDFCKQLGWDLE